MENSIPAKAYILYSLAALFMGIQIGIYLINISDFFKKTDLFLLLGLAMIIIAAFVAKKKDKEK